VGNRVTRRFTAKQAEFEVIRDFIEAACADIEDDERRRAVLLVEELFANSVLHGYGGDSEQPVWLTLELETDGCRIVYEDCAPAYDPFSVDEPDLDATLPEDRPIGGLGIVFLNELSTARSYARRGDRNVIEMQVRRAVPQ
jgi:anti-sigma regulatory factor (Ser/Thr protein kinase)